MSEHLSDGQIIDGKKEVSGVKAHLKRAENMASRFYTMQTEINRAKPSSGTENMKAIM